MYYDCPRMAYYRINDYVEIAPFYKESVERGIMVHKIIEKFYSENIESLTLTEIKLKLAEIYHTMSTIHNEKIENALLNFAKFEVWRKEKMYEVAGVEKEVSREYKGVTIHGIIDLLLRIGDRKIVVDWKTGYNGFVTDEIIRQLSMYSWIVNADLAYAVFLDWGNWEEIEPIDVTTDLDEIINDHEYRKTYSHCDTCRYQIVCLGDNLVFHI